METYKIGDQDLIGVIGHIEYEWSMLEQSAAILSKYAGDQRAMLVGTVGRGAYSMVVESFAVHMRNLVEFLTYRNDGQPNLRYVRAYHFFRDPSYWMGSLTKHDCEFLDKLHEKACIEVSHLTYDRSGRTSEQFEWDVGKIYDKLKELYDTFRLKYEMSSQSIVKQTNGPTGRRRTELLKSQLPSGSLNLITGSTASGDPYRMPRRNGNGGDTAI